MAHKRTPKWLQWIEYLLFRCLTESVSILPLKLDYALISVAADLAYCLLGRHRRRAIEHVLHSGIRTTEAEARALVRANFRHIGKVFVEIVKAPKLLTRENFTEHIRLECLNKEAERFFSAPDSENVIVITGHLGNWELAGQAYCFFSGRELVSIMRPLDNALMGDYIYRHREHFGHTTVSKTEGIVPVFRSMLRGKSIAIVADQHAGSRDGEIIQFCGHPARAHKSPAVLSIRAKRPIICGMLVRLDDDFHFKLIATGPLQITPTGDLDTDVRTIVQKYSDVLEQFVRKYPEQWLWAHRRWLDCNRKHHP